VLLHVLNSARSLISGHTHNRCAKQYEPVLFVVHALALPPKHFWPKRFSSNSDLVSGKAVGAGRATLHPPTHSPNRTEVSSLEDHAAPPNALNFGSRRMAFLRSAPLRGAAIYERPPVSLRLNLTNTGPSRVFAILRLLLLSKSAPQTRSLKLVRQTNATAAGLLLLLGVRGTATFKNPTLQCKYRDPAPLESWILCFTPVFPLVAAPARPRKIPL